MRTIAPPASSGVNNTKINYTLTGSDNGKSVLLYRDTPIVSNLSSNWKVDLKNAGNVRISLITASGTIDGKKQISLYPNESCTLISDGINIFTFNRSRSVVMQNIIINSPTFDGSLNVIGLNDPEIVGIQFDFSVELSAADTLYSSISLNNNFINTGTAYFSFYDTTTAGNGNSQTARWYNCNYSTDLLFIGTINLSGFGSNRLIYKSDVAPKGYYHSLSNGYFDNGSSITNFDGFRLFTNAGNKFISGFISATGLRN